MKNTVTIYEFIGLILKNKPPKVIFIEDGADAGTWYLHTENDTIEYSTDKHNTITTLDWNYYIENQKHDILVRVLPEENDEWEDIEEINDDYYDENTNTISKHGRHIDTYEIVPILNQLIKNQKYLKEKLESKDD